MQPTHVSLPTISVHKILNKIFAIVILVPLFLIFSTTRANAADTDSNTFIEDTFNDNETDIILIITALNPDTKRISEFTNTFEQQILKSSINYEIDIESLNCNDIANSERWISDIETSINKYTSNKSKNLKAMVLLGQESWSSFLSSETKIDSIPIFCAYVSSNGIILPAEKPSQGKWMPKSEDMRTISKDKGNIGGLLNYYDIKRNIELIQSLYPTVENIAFLSDNTYGGVSLQSYFIGQMQEHFPNLQMTLIDARDSNRVMLTKLAAMPKRSAILIGTWRTGNTGQYLMQNALSEIRDARPDLPIFTLTGTGLGSVAVGGYTPDYDNAANTIAEQIINSNSTPTYKTYFKLQSNHYRFDAKLLKAFKISEYSLPKGSIIVDTTAAQLSRYTYYIELLELFICLLVLMLIVVIFAFRRSRTLKRSLEEREKELIKAKEHAEESDRLKSAFLANMSHEIRTPLNAIVGFSSLLKDETLTHEERTEYSSLIVNNSDMLLMLLNDILDISSLECGIVSFNYASDDVVAVCQQVILTTAHTRQNGVECEFLTPCDHYMLYTDTHRLSQILINMMTNAGKYTSKGKITLAIKIDEPHNVVIFSVTDTGCGIPLDKQGIVFNRFEKLNTNKPGTGLGLAICKQVADIVGGKIYVDPQYIHGTRIVFEHPILQKDKELQGENKGGGFPTSSSNRLI